MKGNRKKSVKNFRLKSNIIEGYKIFYKLRKEKWEKLKIFCSMKYSGDDV